MPRIVFDLGVGDELVSGVLRVRLVHKSGRVARLVVEAPTAVTISLARAPRNQVGPDDFDRALQPDRDGRIEDA